MITNGMRSKLLKGISPSLWLELKN